MFELMFFLLLFLFSDLVAIPDFLAGAMENWGLITFRETSLLVGKQSSLLEKQVVASVVAHELAHQVSSLCCLGNVGEPITQDAGGGGVQIMPCSVADARRKLKMFVIRVRSKKQIKGSGCTHWHQ